MADETTLLANLVDPQVMAPMIAAQLPKAIKFSGIAPIDTTLEGQPGSTITVPKYKYIGDAVDVAEGAAIDYTKLSTETDTHTIKKAGKGVKITDEAALSGYGDPEGEAQRQIRMAIASKVDNDILAAAQTATLEVSAEINLDLIDTLESTFVDAPDNFEDVDSTGVLFLSYKDAAKLRKEAAASWTRASELGDNILINGAFGEVLGWEIVRSQKIIDGTGIAVKSGALKTFLKRSVLAERERDIDHKLTKFNADQHYAVALVDESRVVKISKSVAPTGVTLNKTTLSLAVGANETLTATVAPSNATDKSVTYSSDDSTIATVTPVQGKVVGVKAGKANITATTANGKSATCVVTVTG